MIFPGRCRLHLGHVDPQQTKKVKEKTLVIYRKALKPFTDWLLHHQENPTSAEEWDLLLGEWKIVSDLNLNQFQNLVAAFEFVFPRYKGQLEYCRAILKGWAIEYEPAHAVPMGTGPCALFGCHFSARGHPRLGIAIILQRARGLRPGEVLGIEPQHISVPWEQIHLSTNKYLVINLGVRHGTKHKRPQSVVVSESEFPFLYRQLLILKHFTPPSQKVFPYSLPFYRKEIRSVEKSLNLKIGWSCHGPRSGFASESRAEGMPFQEVKEIGRWLNDASLRIYIDCVQAASINTSLQSSGLGAAQAYCLQNLAQYFPVEWLRFPY